MFIPTIVGTPTFRKRIDKLVSESGFHFKLHPCAVLLTIQPAKCNPVLKATTPPFPNLAVPKVSEIPFSNHQLPHLPPHTTLTRHLPRPLFAINQINGQISQGLGFLALFCVLDRFRANSTVCHRDGLGNHYQDTTGDATDTTCAPSSAPITG
jgi:hypothetical protein